jgi:hypothetical protein
MLYQLSYALLTPPRAMRHQRPSAAIIEVPTPRTIRLAQRKPCNYKRRRPKTPPWETSCVGLLDALDL